MEASSCFFSLFVFFKEGVYGSISVVQKQLGKKKYIQPQQTKFKIWQISDAKMKHCCHGNAVSSSWGGWTCLNAKTIAMEIHSLWSKKGKVLPLLKKKTLLILNRNFLWAEILPKAPTRHLTGECVLCNFAFWICKTGWRCGKHRFLPGSRPKEDPQSVGKHTSSRSWAWLHRDCKPPSS